MKRNELLVASRWIPEGAEEIKGENCVAYKWSSLQPCAMGFIGNAGKHAFYHSFRSAEARDRFVAKWLEDRAAVARYKAERLAEKKAKLAAGHNLKVGDVLEGSWGYDQTNVEFYQVTALIGKRMVEISELAQDSEATGFMCGQCVPVPGKFTGKKARKLVDEGNNVKLYDFGCWLRKKEPAAVVEGMPMYQPRYWSAYA